MEAFSTYLQHLDALIASRSDYASNIKITAAIDAALDGQPAKALRRLVPIKDMRSAGAFFTGSELSNRALKPIFDTIDDKSVILDPACGVGDLLIACAAHLTKKESYTQTLASWGAQIIGRDLHPEFIHATKARLLLTAYREGFVPSSIELSKEEKNFPNIRRQCGLTDHDAINAATHIVINPPFTAIISPEDCQWAKGKINSAALFIESCILHARPGTRMVAILPDVLRSGTRYKKWRNLIESRTQIHRVELYGKFDRWADVDVFTLELEIKKTAKSNGHNPWELPLNLSAECVGNYFNVCVGPVVDYRDPHRGPWHPFVKARNLNPWQTIRDIPWNRRFTGRVLSPPFVVVRRTSRPGDKYRATGTIITGDRPVAVENHLLILIPKSGTVKTCKELLKIFKKPETTQWLDQRIRCRHLTISSLADLPWLGNEKSE